MYVNSLKLIEMRGSPEPVRRNFAWATDGDFVNHIEAMARETQCSFNSVLLDKSNEIIGFAADKHEEVNPYLLEDWDEKRFLFVMDIQLEEATKFSSVEKRAIIQGYTDRAETVRSGGNVLVEPETTFVINSITTVKDVFKNGKTQSYVIDLDQTILGEIGNAFSDDNGDMLIRSSDMFAYLDLQEDELLQAEVDDSTKYIDERTSFLSGARISKRAESTASTWLSNIINNDIRANSLRGDDEELDYSNRNDIAWSSSDGASYLDLSKNTFLRALRHYMSDSNNPNFEGISFDYEDIARLCGMNITGVHSLDSVTDITEIDEMYWETEDWGSANAEELAAQKICHIIPHIVFSKQCDSISFVADNTRGMTMEPNIFIEDLFSYLGDSVRNHSVIRAVTDMIRTQVFEPISMNNELLVRMEVDCTVSAMTTVHIQIEDGEMVPYTFPSFADASAAPTVTRDTDIITDLVEGYSNVRSVVDSVNESISLDTSMDNARKARSRRNRKPINNKRDLSSLIDEDDLPRRKNIDLLGDL